MAKQAKKSETVAEETAQKAKKTDAKAQIPENVQKMMKLYPQYEKIWVTPEGFVHPVTAPSYITKNATLYDNIFYNK